MAMVLKGIGNSSETTEIQCDHQGSIPIHRYYDVHQRLSVVRQDFIDNLYKCLILYNYHFFTDAYVIELRKQGCLLSFSYKFILY
jgi:hypothetical protein